MAQTIVVAGNEVQGNISSCKTEISIINGYERPSLFWRKDVGYATNNCTGQTDIYHSWSLTGTTGFVSLLFVLIFIAWLFKNY